MASPEDRLLDFDEAVAYLNVTTRWLRRAVAERRIEHIKVGRLLRFRKDALESYLSAQTRRPVEIRTAPASQPSPPRRAKAAAA